MELAYKANRVERFIESPRRKADISEGDWFNSRPKERRIKPGEINS